VFFHGGMAEWSGSPITVMQNTSIVSDDAFEKLLSTVVVAAVAKSLASADERFLLRTIGSRTRTTADHDGAL